MTLTRRNFMKAAGVTAAAAMTMGAITGCAREGVGTHREEVGGNEAGDEAHGDEKERRGGVSVPLCGDAVANC